MPVGEAGGEVGGDEEALDALGEAFKDDLEEEEEVLEVLEEAAVALEGFW